MFEQVLANWSESTDLLLVRVALPDSSGGRVDVRQRWQVNVMARVTWRRSGAAMWLLPLLLASCGPPDASATPNSDDDVVVKIVPPLVHTAPGARFEVAVVAFLDGQPVALPVGTPVWSGDDVSFSGAVENTALVTMPNLAGEYEFSVSVDGKTATATALVGAPQSGTHDGVKLAPPMSGATTIPWDGPVASILLDAYELVPGGSTGSCRDDLLVEVAGTASFRRNFSSGCTNKLALFSVSRGALFRCQLGSGDHCNSMLGNLWTSTKNTLSALNLPPTVQVPLAVWFRMNAAREYGVSAAEDDALAASKIFQRGRAGIAFDNIEFQEDGLPKVVGSFRLTDEKCNALPTVPSIEDQLEIIPKAGFLNVVYVQEIQNSRGNSSSLRGFMCDRSDANDQSPIVVLSWTNGSVSTLAHEIAHVMGFIPGAVGDATHTNYLQNADGDHAFTVLNLLWTGEVPTHPLERGHLSLGQVYRMNVDTRSWINVGLAAGGSHTIRNGDKEACQVAWDSHTVCPRLDKDPGQP